MRLGLGITEAPMVGQCSTQGKGLATFPTAMGTGSVVDLSVSLQVGAHSEPSTTIPTLIGFFSSVDSPMSLQVRTPSKTFITVRTLVKLPTSVAELMLG